MKHILLFVSFLFISGVGIWRFVPLSYSVCDQPIYYHVDTVDPRFNLSKEDFLSDTNLAAQIWNTAQNKQLFVYGQKGDLSVNLVYDQRQSLTSQIDQLENQVKSDKQSLNPKISEYQKLSAEFKEKVSSLNKEIEYWNDQGGAPSEVYQNLITKQQDLRQEATHLNTLAQSLNISTGEYNLQVNELNQTINSLNNALEERPEEGIYKGSENKIEIYFNINNAETIHTLAHEFGHALGIMHASNPKAIMYYKTSSTTALTSDDINLLENICRRHSIFELFQNYFLLQYNKIQLLFNQ